MIRTEYYLLNLSFGNYFESHTLYAAGLQSFEKVITRLPYQERLAEKNWNQREIIEFMRLKTWHKKYFPTALIFLLSNLY